MFLIISPSVVTAKQGSDALAIAREKDDLQLVVTEAHLPDMDKYEFLERMQEMSKLPVISKYHSRFGFFFCFLLPQNVLNGRFLLSDTFCLLLLMQLCQLMIVRKPC